MRVREPWGRRVSEFRAPPQADFQAYADLVGHQGEHFGLMVPWSGTQCASTGGLDGALLLPLMEIVPEVAQFFNGKLSQCQRGMGLVAAKIHTTSDDYTRTDQAAATELRSLYPDAFAGFPDIGVLPSGSLLGNFTDEDVQFKEPPSVDDTTSKSIHLALTLASNSSDLKAAEHAFKWCTGQSLVELILTPLVGAYGRLRYLHDAYDQLGDAAYTVAGCLRKASWKLGSEWTGQTATAFDQYLFSWSMGIGGIGDAAKIVAKAYKDGYDVIILLVRSALGKIGELLDNEIAALADQFAKMIAGDAAIEAVGLGPEDPVADVIAGFWTADRLYKMYKIVRAIINTIGVIQSIFAQIVAAVKSIKAKVKQVTDFVGSPPSYGSLIDDVQQRGFEFEKSGGWSPDLGATRIGLLPAA